MAANQQKRKSEPSGSASKVCTRPHAIDFSGEEKITRDSFKDECDINNIVEKFARTGELPQSRQPGAYGDAPEMDAHQAACIAAEAASQLEQDPDLFTEAPEEPLEDGTAENEPVTGSGQKEPEKALQEPSKEGS